VDPTYGFTTRLEGVSPTEARTRVAEALKAQALDEDLADRRRGRPALARGAGPASPTRGALSG
jgi:hypothetical protein